jgi:hypothetical protein
MTNKAKVVGEVAELSTQPMNPKFERATRVLLTDFSRDRFNYTEESVQDQVGELKDETLYGRIGHPSADCSDEEFFSLPDGDARAFKITNVQLLGMQCYGTVVFEDSVTGRTAKNMFKMGSKFSIRAAASDFGPFSVLKKIVTWDLC